MTVVVAGCLLVEHADVGVALGFINLEIEVRSGLNLLVDILSESLLLFSPDLFFKTESLELLLHQLVDAALDVLNVLVVVLVDFADPREDALLLLRAAKLGEPLSLSGLLLLLLLEVHAGVALK